MRTRVRTIELRTRGGHLEDRSTRAKPEYRNRARFFPTEERRPAQGPSQGLTSKGPSQGFYTRVLHNTGRKQPAQKPTPNSSTRKKLD
uniref:Uncharacterized protein n=1 Tax=Vespula pensylvanica TaxID=30213 RepID=A0A834P8X1_VESPE|nr:hypothetical protein H0235_005117 [Vespula pensylvanica]